MLHNYSTKLWPTLRLSPPIANHLCDNSNSSPWPPAFTHYLSSLSNVKFVSCSTGRIGRRPCPCRARRRVRYEAEEEDDDEGSGYNEEVAMLEMYSQSARNEALLVTAMVDDQEVELLIFKGFSSSLSYETSPDPTKSIIPQRATIKSVNRIRGPFNPSNIEYIEKDLPWENFKSRLSTK